MTAAHRTSHIAIIGAHKRGDTSSALEANI
jgi:hypothetical protein